MKIVFEKGKEGLWYAHTEGFVGLYQGILIAGGSIDAVIDKLPAAFKDMRDAAESAGFTRSPRRTPVSDPFSVADKVVSLAEDGLRGIDRTIGAWPAEFRAIIWEAVVEIASRRASSDRVAAARDRVGTLGNPGK